MASSTTTPVSLAEILTDDVALLTHNDDQPKTIGELRAKHKAFGMYFSAHWCAPCRGCTPMLKMHYERIKASPSDADMEVVFVSLDRKEQEFGDYFGNDMPWTALKFAAPQIDLLREACGISGIPRLPIVESATLHVIHPNATNDMLNSQRPWPYTAAP